MGGLVGFCALESATGSLCRRSAFQNRIVAIGSSTIRSLYRRVRILVRNGGCRVGGIHSMVFRPQNSLKIFVIAKIVSGISRKGDENRRCDCRGVPPTKAELLRRLEVS